MSVSEVRDRIASDEAKDDITEAVYLLTFTGTG